MALLFEICDLWHPNGDGTFRDGQPIATLWKGHDGNVKIPLMDQATAEVKYSVQNVDAWACLLPYRTRLRVWLVVPWGRFPIYDGIIIDPELDTESKTITVKSVDHSLRLSRHYFGLHDRVLKGPTDDPPNSFDKKVPLTGQGVSWILEAAQNLPGNQEDHYPPLGIHWAEAYDESWEENTAPPVAYQRGDEVLRTLHDHTQIYTSPEWQFIPTDNIEGRYVDLYTTMRLGLHDPVHNIWVPNETIAAPYLLDYSNGTLPTDLAYEYNYGSFEVPFSDARFEAGFGKDNCEIKHRPGGHVTTHAHVLSDGENLNTELRITEVAEAALREDIGVYVDWDQTTFKDKDTNSLRYRGRQIIYAYGRVQQGFDVTLKGNCEYGYMKDYLLGSVVGARYVSGTIRLDGLLLGRINQIDLTQDPDSLRGHKEVLTLIPEGTNFDTAEDF